MTKPETFVVAAAQATPVFLDKQATLDKACELIAEAGRNGARLIVFPEAFFPAYPEWVWLLSGGEQALLDELYAELVENAIAVPDEATEKLCQAARKARINVVMGMNERNREASNASLYNALLYIDDAGNILGTHRKLIPTAGERTVWAQGDGSTLEVYDTSVGRLGGLICWENYMPLARNAMYAWGTQVYVAPTWDRGDLWIASLRHIAKEGGVYVIGCCQPLRLADIPDRLVFKQRYGEGTDWINSGHSCIVDPGGHIIAGPLVKEEALLYAEVDLRRIAAAKRMFDAAGHYARPDVFKFAVNRSPNPVLRLAEAENG
ncbi:MAG: carbon-nitrogen hydrolase family protein [Chloroflexi bacterium]|nr:MAG: carbon-nitrogen hydrolase family protein [Chloroflexota bacterium]